jgi:hypothetical protein
MSLTFSDLQIEVKRRAQKDSGGSTFDNAIKNLINTSLFRVSREALWRPLRRKTTFDTVTTYSTGSGAGTFTNASKNVTVTGATFITDGIKIGRRISLSGDSNVFTIRTITGETTLTIDQNYGGTTTSVGEYSILAQEEYNLPIQAGHKVFLWHEQWGYPFQLQYVPDQEFIGSGILNTTESVPVAYRMWGENMVIGQPLQASVVTIVSSSTSDTTGSVTIFGVVSGYPDYETINLNGTTSAAGNKSFTSIERVIKSSSTIGRVTVTTNSGNNTLAVLPVGDTTSGILYKKIQLFPLPNEIIPINVQYYKDPFRLVNEEDIHELGQEFDEAIILLATSKMKYENNQTEGDKFYALYQDEIRSLRRTNADKIDWFPKQGRPNLGRVSMVHPYLSYTQIGANYGRRV